MSATNIPEKIKIRLWGKAAGRCEYEGCNEPLWLDSLTQFEFNTAYIAHIIADRPNGPRGDKILSPQLAADISNLMLMCDKHHRLIDKEDVKGHPVERLRRMKKNHETRIKMVTSINNDMKSHVLFYGANIGEHNANLSWKRAVTAMHPFKYPVEEQPIELGIGNSPFHDNNKTFWNIERENLIMQFKDKVKDKVERGSVAHLSIFALAPQPLLIKLGTLLSDIYPADVYQLHREPPTWKWQEEPKEFEFIIKEPRQVFGLVALNLSLSADITENRITKVLGNDVSIWTITVNNPNNDFLKSKVQLSKFRALMRKVFNKIKYTHDETDVIHVFPAMPVSSAVELGRVWMPKADLALSLYDENRNNGGFIHTFDIGNIADRTI